MAEWFLIWILIVEKYDGEIRETQPMSQKMSSQSECFTEADEKMFELEEQIGGNYYFTVNYRSKVAVGGEIVGVKVGCEQRTQ